MHRTTIMLPSRLKNRAQALASRRGISIGELIRESLEEKLHLSKSESKAEEPFFKDTNFFDGDVPIDISEMHDRYLYDHIY